MSIKAQWKSSQKSSSKVGMGFTFNSLVPEFTDEYVTVKSVARFSGYNQQYLRRLLRKRVFRTRKLGQIWLIDRIDFKNYLVEAHESEDQRCGPRRIR